MGLVDPERELVALVRVPQLDASSAVLTALEVGEGVVQHGRAYGARPAEVVVGPPDRQPLDRDATLVRAQQGARRYAERERIHEGLGECEGGVVAAPVRAGPRPAIDGGRPYPQARVREL